MLRDIPSPSFLRKILKYDSETGLLFWKERTVETMPTEGERDADWMLRSWNSRHAGNEAGWYGDSGYKMVTIHGRDIYFHRVAFAIATGEWPSGEIDHINRVKDDNRIDNLRVVTRQENMKNFPERVGKSGVSGIQVQNGGKFCVRIKDRDGVRRFWSFDKIEDATAKRDQARKEFGYHKNHGRAICRETEGEEVS